VWEPPPGSQRHDVSDGTTLSIYLADAGTGSVGPDPGTYGVGRLHRVYNYLGLRPLRPHESPLEGFQACDSVRVAGTEGIGGERCLRLVAHRRFPDSEAQHRLWLAVDKGYAPVRAEGLWAHLPALLTGGREVVEASDLTEVAGGLWLPMRTVRYRYEYRGGGDDPWAATSELIFQRLEANHPPAASRFRFEFPLGTRVSRGPEVRRAFEGSSRQALRDFQATPGPPIAMEDATYRQGLTGHEFDEWKEADETAPRGG
jgi:hypothetical protein